VSELSRLFACKSVEALSEEAAGRQSGETLPRTLGLLSLTCFGVGSTIGAGIFVLTGTVAALHAGPAVVISFVLAGIACALAGLCYAEFAALVPVAGSAYTYAYATLGELVAWIIGWCLILEYLFASAMVAIGWAGYAVAMAADFGLGLPAALTRAPIDVGPNGLFVTGAIGNLPAMGVVALCTCLAIAGTRLSARINDLIVIAKVIVIVLVGVAGLLFARPVLWNPFIPPQFGVGGVITGAAIVFYAYVGFDAVSTMAQETHNPRRTVPLALIGSLSVCTALYVLIALMVTGLANYRTLDVANPVYVALDAAGRSLAWAKPLVGAVVVIGLISALLVTLLGQVRIFYAMARDGLLPKMFETLHPRWRTPHIGTLVTGVTAAIVAGIFPLNLLGELISIGTLLAFAIVCMGVILLRRRRPDLPRSFRVPLYPWTPLAGMVVCLALMASLPADTWIRLAVWLGLGLVVYAIHGVRHSTLRRSQRDQDRPQTRSPHQIEPRS